MIDAVKVIQLIQRTTGYNDKLYLLKKCREVYGLKPILKFIYDPYVRTGISTAKLMKAMSMPGTLFGHKDEPIHFYDALEYFEVHTTGSDADLVMAARFINCTKSLYPDEPYAAEVAKAIVTQSLTIGITATSLNTAYGADFIPKIGCILGTPYEDVTPAKVKWPCIVTEKLDGARRILVKENGKVRIYSRSGHEDTGLVDIMADAKYLPNNMVYDGELLAAGTFKDCIAQRQATSSLSSGGGAKTGVTFNVFDMIPVEEFHAGASTQDALNRKIRLGATFMDNSIQCLDERWVHLIAAYGMHKQLEHIKPVPVLGIANNMAEVEPIVADIWSRGGEGVMLNTASGKYMLKRSKDLLKVKRTEEHKLKVVGLEEGTGKFEDMLGALVVDYKGNKLGVGSGLTEAQRYTIWNNPDVYLGQYIEIETFGESTNAAGQKSLNCPIFKRFVKERD